MADADGAQTSGVVARFAGLNRRKVDDQRVGLERLDHLSVKQHFIHHGSVFQQADDDVCRAHGLGGLGVNGRAEWCKSVGLLACAVPGVDRVACFAKTPSQQVAHLADTQYCNFHCSPPEK